MPERVWIGHYSTLPNPMTAPCWLSDPARVGDKDPYTAYVPESRLREVEAENAQLRRIIEQRANGTDLLTEQLRAERDALAHQMMRYGWHDQECPFIQDTLPCQCGYEAVEAAARAVLARMEGT